MAEPMGFEMASSGSDRTQVSHFCGQHATFQVTFKMDHGGPLNTTDVT